MSFASQKNDMLLRNMIYSLNANMIGSTASNMICLPCGKRFSYFQPMCLPLLHNVHVVIPTKRSAWRNLLRRRKSSTHRNTIT